MSLRGMGWVAALLILGGLVIFFWNKTTRGFGCGVMAGGIACYVIALIHAFRLISSNRTMTDQTLEQIAKHAELEKEKPKE